MRVKIRDEVVSSLKEFAVFEGSGADVGHIIQFSGDVDGEKW